MQAGGQINLEQDAGDAVQLMTVHAAKGLEFEHVFVLRLTSRGFPISQRKVLLEFPEALMKEEVPKGDFHTQEERRLFYVALTRATRTADAFHGGAQALEAVSVSRRYSQRAEAGSAERGAVGARQRGCACERTRCGRAFAGRLAFRGAPPESTRALAYRQMGGRIPASGVRAAAAQRVGHRVLSKMPAEISVWQCLGDSGRSPGGNYVRQRDAHDHPAIHRGVGRREAFAVRRDGAYFPPRMDFGGFRRRLPGKVLSGGWTRTVARLSRYLYGEARPRCWRRKSVSCWNWKMACRS